MYQLCDDLAQNPLPSFSFCPLGQWIGGRKLQFKIIYKCGPMDRPLVDWVFTFLTDWFFFFVYRCLKIFYKSKLIYIFIWLFHVSILIYALLDQSTTLHYNFLYNIFSFFNYYIKIIYIAKHTLLLKKLRVFIQQPTKTSHINKFVCNSQLNFYFRCKFTYVIYYYWLLN
jgi:hypothetical protein